MQHIKTLVSRSKAFKIILILALLYASFRLMAQVALVSGFISLESIQGDKEYLWRDLQVYLEAAQHFKLRQDLYFTETSALYPYPYAPSFALAFIPFTWLSSMNAVRLHTLLHILAYIFLYFRWKQIFDWLQLERADKIMAWTLPVWLMFSAFWNDLNALNIGVYMAVFSTLLIEAILKENLVEAIIWLSVILQIKPHWSFAAAVPLLLGRWRFFIKLIAGALCVYLGVVVVIMLIAGPLYGCQQHVDYVRRLLAYRGDFPWRTPADAPFLGFNHSLMQTIYFFLGISSGTTRLANILKLALLLPLMGMSLRFLLNSIDDKTPFRFATVGLDLAFALYLGVFLWLDVVWELSLGIVVFSYLLMTLDHQRSRILVFLVWLPYALSEFWEFLSLVALGRDALSPNAYVITNPNVYIPTIMIALLIFYSLLLWRLWQGVSQRKNDSRGSFQNL